MFSSPFLKPVACLILGTSTIFGTSAANALTFNWSWTPTSYSPSSPTGPVTGTISGLLDNAQSQINGVAVTVTSSPTTPSGGWDNSAWLYDSGAGFTVANGVVTGFDATYVSPLGSPFQGLVFSDGTQNIYPTLSNLTINYSHSNPTAISTTFTPVPGPLPILSIPSVILFSRNLKKRIKARKESSSGGLA
jgi:hypothetical protein